MLPTKIPHRILIVTCVFLITMAAGMVWSEVIAGEEETVASTAYVEQWGPAIGNDAPKITALTIQGDESDRESITGKKGLLIFFIRSTGW